MYLASFVLLPLVAGLLALLVRPNGPRRGVLAMAAAAHLALTGAAWVRPPEPGFGGILGLDALGLLFLTITSILFAAAAFYGVGYLRAEDAGLRPDFQEGGLFSNAPEARFTACLLFFLAAMSLVTLAQHVALVWVAVEATTLASAPLIYFHRHRRSLEAAWKYLMICSVGIALALMGNILLAAAAEEAGGSLRVADLVARAAMIHGPWFKAAFVFILVGYGTKMGLAPLHTWLPDAHSESPSLVSALLSGALLNCAFLGILRVYQVGAAAGLAPYCQELLTGFGLFSVALAAAFIVGQGDFKRMLAYSSVEHMGLLALGMGLGGGAVFGSLFHAVNHSLTKAMLFLVSGNILALYHSKSSYDVRGVGRAMPRNGILWMAGFLAIAGTPPFGVFVSEFTIFQAAFASGHTLVGGIGVALLALIFLGMATSVLRMVQGPVPPAVQHRVAPEQALTLVPPAVLCGLALCLGLYVPEPLQTLLRQAAALLGA